MAIESALQTNAAFLMCPCCVGKLKFSLAGGSSKSTVPGVCLRACSSLPLSRDKSAVHMRVHVIVRVHAHKRVHTCMRTWSSCDVGGHRKCKDET
jgi:hypothetical protein